MRIVWRVRRQLPICLVGAVVGLLLVPATARAGVATGFEDVPDGSTFAAPISWLRTVGTARGCNPPDNTRFCPDATITRGQMAALLTRALELPAAGADFFSDDAASVFEDDINRLAAADITAGCNPPVNTAFCPYDPVTRGEAAAFLTRAFDLTAGAGSDRFRDDDGSVFETDIDRLATAGVTYGCDPPENTRFCPARELSRAEMAAMLWRTLGRPSPVPPTRLVAAGDIARCSVTDDDATGRLLDELFATTNGVVAALGDTAYGSGTPTEFAECYEPAWGRHRFRTRPAVGNHEYLTADASGYFDYFGPAAGSPEEGWYSYDLAGWHIVVLNSVCAEVGGCAPDSPQGEWLTADLAQSQAECTLAYMHYPRFSSGVHGDSSAVRDLWDQLYEAGAEVVLAGHDHDYERFAPMSPDGVIEPATGIREFVVGTGGTTLRPTGAARDGSERLLDSYHGVLSIDLTPAAYSWQFIDTDGVVRDSGSDGCH
jgi:hypothetical protein